MGGGPEQPSLRLWDMQKKKTRNFCLSRGLELVPTAGELGSKKDVGPTAICCPWTYHSDCSERRTGGLRVWEKGGNPRSGGPYLQLFTRKRKRPHRSQGGGWAAVTRKKEKGVRGGKMGRKKPDQKNENVSMYMGGRLMLCGYKGIWGA